MLLSRSSIVEVESRDRAGRSHRRDGKWWQAVESFLDWLLPTQLQLRSRIEVSWLFVDGVPE